MKKDAGLIFLGLMMLLSCDTGVHPPPISGAKIEKGSFTNIVIRLTDYNQIEVSHQLGSDLYSNELVAVSIGIKDTISFTERARTSASFDNQAGVYRLWFSITAKMDSTKLIAPVTVRYLLADSSSIDIDTSVALYTYPYSSAQILVAYPDVGPVPIQDFDFIGNRFFFHPTGPYGLYEYDLLTKQLTPPLILYGGGDHMAADSNFVFCENHRNLYRYNLTTDSAEFYFQALPERVSGMDTRNGYLYVVAGYPPISIRRYTYDAVLIDSTVFSAPEGVYYMTIDSDILYMNTTIEPTRLKRYDLQTNTFMTDVMGPSYELVGIKIYQGVLYFSDFNKLSIGYVSVSDLRN